MKTIHFETIDSTNTYLKENYSKLDDFTFVSADFQSKGRGRNNRNWKSEKGESLLFSLLIKDESLMKEFKSLSIISALSLIQAFETMGIKDLSIKWPNDIYYKDNKLVGILLEAVSTTKLECLIVGIGINVNQKEFEGDYKRQPTSLYKILNKDIDIDNLKNVVYQKLEENFSLVKKGFDFYPKITKYDYLKNKELDAYLDDEKMPIKVIGINNDYSLKIVVNNQIRDIESGEISFHV